MYAMNIQNDVIGLVLRENCKSKQMTGIIAWPSRCHGRIYKVWYQNVPISYHYHRGNTFQRQNYKMRLKQRSLNWINSMQVKKILFTNVFFSWSLCLLNMFPSMIDLFTVTATDTVPSINKCAEHNKITEYFMWWPVCPVDSIYPRRSRKKILTSPCGGHTTFPKLSTATID
jgi:hypothetical protein